MGAEIAGVMEVLWTDRISKGQFHSSLTFALGNPNWEPLPSLFFLQVRHQLLE